jgi:tetratricopeptide (TPR) repeat protein
MKIKKMFFLTVIVLIVLVVPILTFSPSFAETIKFEKEYSYTVSLADSRLSCRTIAFEEAKWDLIKQLEMRLESSVEIGNLELTRDEVTTITSGIITPEAVEEKFGDESCSLKVKIEADSDEIITSIVSLYKELRNINTLQNSRKEAAELLKEARKLKYDISMSETERDVKIYEYINVIEKLRAIQWFERGFAFDNANKYVEAIEAYNRAIEINPEFAEAFFDRGGIYQSLGSYQLALNDYDRSIELNPDFAEAYDKRGGTYCDLGSYRRAIDDYTKVVEMKPMDADAYYKRGMVYYNRFLCFGKIDSLESSFSDLAMAAKMGYEKAQDLLSSLYIDWNEY